MKFGNVSLPPAVVEILIIVSVLIVASILLALYLLSRSGPSKNKNPDPQHPLAKKKQAHKKRPRSRRVALLQIVGGDKLIIPFADGAAHEPIQRPAFSA